MKQIQIFEIRFIKTENGTPKAKHILKVDRVIPLGNLRDFQKKVEAIGLARWGYGFVPFLCYKNMFK